MSQLLHLARIRAADLRITGCTCGWQVPDHDPDSDTAFAFHVIKAPDVTDAMYEAAYDLIRVLSGHRRKRSLGKRRG